MKKRSKVAKVAYFDTNVFDHIYKKLHGITKADEATLRSLVSAGIVSIPLSVLNLEEILLVLERETRRDLIKAELQLILDLADWRRMVKEPKHLLSDDIVTYTQGKAASCPFIEEARRQKIHAGIREMLLNLSPQSIPELLGAVSKAKTQIAKFKQGMDKGQEILSPLIKKLRNEGQRLPRFDQWWERLAVGLAEGYAERVGVLDACRERGIQDLLKVRSVQMAVGVSLSLIYAQTFEGRKPKPSDSRDILHAAAAAATTDMLVTHDSDFARLLPRVSVSDFQQGTLHDFLKRIP
jgi:predicted nucleic acid-binding protein